LLRGKKSSSMAEERERIVTFHGRVQFKTIRHVADFTDDEIVEGWYQKQDFARMSEEVGEIAKLLAEGKKEYNGEEISIRGLEHLVEEDVADYRAGKMVASIDAVLDEQDEQRNEDVHDPEAIAMIYSEIVTPLLREAYLVGLRDAEEAQQLATEGSESESESARKKDDPLDKIKKTNDKDKATILPKEVSKTKETPATVKITLNVPAPAPPKPHSFRRQQLPVPTVSDEGEVLLKSKEEEAQSPKKSMSKEERKAAAEARKKRDRTGTASEMSPLVRRRDGSFAFRRKDLESATAALKKERRDAVKDSLFKFLDSPDPSFGK
jgi:hypothetical protein